MIEDKLRQVIKGALADLGIQAPEIKLEHPADLAHGDFSTNVALAVKTDARKIKEELEKNLPAEVERIEIAGPGFINFYLSEKFFAEALKEILDKREDFGRGRVYKDQKTIIEYTDPNPFKEFHIGHLMSNSIGEAISRLVEFSGAEVKRACYQGDVGLHVAKAIWGFKQVEGATPYPIQDYPAAFSWGRAYARGSLAFEQNEDDKKEIISINKKIYDKSDSEINHIYETGRQICLDYFETIYKRLGTHFDFYFFESETGPFGKKIVEENIGKVFEQSDGAVVFRAEKHNPSLHTRVFINSAGLPTYEAKELGLAQMKYDKYPYDKSIVITGNEVNAYFQVLMQALGLIFPQLADKTTHISHGMLRLPTGKMSSRTGDVISGESLLDEVKKQREGITDEIAVAAIKYSILKQDINQDIIFDFDKSLSLSGNSGPYLQYTYARTCSILQKAGKVKPFEKTDIPTPVEKLLYRFPEVVERAAREYAPHHLCTYLYELASAFSSYYADHQIVSAEPESAYRVALTAAVGQVLKNGLTLLGIATPEKM